MSNIIRAESDMNMDHMPRSVQDILSDINSTEFNDLQSSYQERRMNIYDFRRPDKITKHQIRILENIFESYARNFANELQNMFSCLCEIRVASVEQFTYSEYIMSISNPNVMFMFRMEPLEITNCFSMNTSLMCLFMDRLCGGFGKPQSWSQEITPICQNVTRDLVSRGLDRLAESFEHIGDFQPKITNFETNPMFVQLAPPNETVILITFEVQISKSMGMMEIMMPVGVVERLFEMVENNNWYKKPEPTDNTRDFILSELSNTSLDVSAIIAEQNITLGELTNLAIGDIIKLGTGTVDEANSNIKIQIDNEVKAAGSLCTDKYGRNCIEVKEVQNV